MWRGRPPSSRVLKRPIEREVGDFLPSIDSRQQMRAIELHDLGHRLELVVLRISAASGDMMCSDMRLRTGHHQDHGLGERYDVISESFVVAAE